MHFPHLDIINQPLPRMEFIFQNSYVTLDVAPVCIQTFQNSYVTLDVAPVCIQTFQNSYVTLDVAPVCIQTFYKVTVF